MPPGAETRDPEEAQSTGPLTQQRCKDGAIHGVHQESFLLVILTSKRGKDMQGWMVSSGGHTINYSLMVKSRLGSMPLWSPSTSVSLSCPICKMGIIIICLISLPKDV